MRIESRLVLVIGVILLLSASASGLHSYMRARDLAVENLHAQAEKVRGVVMSLRRVYQKKLIESGMPITEQTVELLPAHTLSRIGRDFQNWDNSGFSFNTVSDDPRNPRNRADAVETAAIDHFRTTPGDEIFFSPFTSPDGSPWYIYARPIRVEKYCLRCHGAREDAPEVIRELYPEAYDYKEGDLRGILSIKLPGSSVDALAWRAFRQDVGFHAMGFLATFFAAIILIRRYVRHPLGRLAQGMRAVSEGNYTQRLAGNEGELAEVEASFNDMARRIPLQQAELRKLSQAMEQSPAAVVITDAAGDIEYVNPKFVEITGYMPLDVIGRNPRILKSGQTPESVYRELWKTISEGGVWRGEMLNRKKTGEMFWEYAVISPVREPDGSIAHYVAVKEDISVRKSYEETLLRRAHYDDMTDLPNRLLAMDRLAVALARAGREKLSVAVMFVDLDQFKRINDTMGHAAGDELLRICANRLLACVRESDTVARFSGDQFMVVLPDLDAAVFAETIVQKMMAAMAKPFSIGEREVRITASFGLAVAPADGNDPHVLMRNADAAMNRAKETGRNAYRFFTQTMNDHAVQRMEREQLLRHALEREELFLVFQPIIAAASGRVVAAEALLRWNSPELGLVPPDGFIPLAEESGLIVDIGRWVLNEACRKVVEWRAAGYSLRMAVNISTRQFRGDGDLLAAVETALAASGLAPGDLELEMTEGLLLEDSPFAKALLEALDDMGVRLAIDDFGTGYSSLGYLKRYPFDTLKIDRSFVADLTADADDDALVAAILAMAQALGLGVVAEGVEKAEQLEFLKQRGCERIQGFHISRPLSADDFLEFLGKTTGSG